MATNRQGRQDAKETELNHQDAKNTKKIWQGNGVAVVDLGAHEVLVEDDHAGETFSVNDSSRKAAPRSPASRIASSTASRETNPP